MLHLRPSPHRCNGVPYDYKKYNAAQKHVFFWGPTLLRFLWVILAAVAAFISLIGIPARINELSSGVCLYVKPSDAVCVANYLFWEILHASSFITVAAIIMRYKSQDYMAILLAYTLIAIGVTEAGMSDALINYDNEWSWPIWSAPVYILRAIALGCSLCLLYTFPDGKFTPRWLVILILIWISSLFVWLINPLLNLIWQDFPNVPGNPMNGNSWRSSPVFSVMTSIILAGTGIYAQSYKYRFAKNITQKNQIKFVMFGLIAATLGMLVYYITTIWIKADGEMWTAYQFTRPATYGASMLAFLICMGVSIFKYHLWDIDVIINKAFVYSVLTICIIVTYAILVAGLDTLFRTSGHFIVSLISAAFIAVLFQPLRERLQSWANRMMYGDRDDPYVILARLGRRLEEVLLPSAILPTIVETIQDSLKLPYVGIALSEPGTISQSDQQEVTDAIAHDEFQVVTERGVRKTPVINLPLAYQGEQVGYLLLAYRSPDEKFSPAERRLLEDVAREAGVAVQTMRLARDLQQARELLVAAREEERRRLRRELHDGLGAKLVGQTLMLAGVRKSLRRDPDSAEAIIAGITKEIQQIIADLRQIIEGLRPPVLDELGLAEALRVQASQFQAGGVHIMVEVPEPLPPLPAAIEAACYRIAQEALNNVVRHAQAQVCVVRLIISTTNICLEVRDDGIGIGEHHRFGVGLHSMRERALELGGTLDIESISGHGTSIRALLPSRLAAREL